jgi:hypothetical protein
MGLLAHLLGNQRLQSRIQGSHSDGYEGLHLQGYNVLTELSAS